jgi:hypothetical protein
MPLQRFRWLVGSLALLGVLSMSARADASAATAVFKAGFAERDITPELGMEVPGGYGKAYCRTIHDPCKVRAAVFDDGKSRVALVSTDGGFIFRPVVQAAREAIRRQCGIPPEAVLIGATHSHSSGPLGMVQPGQYDHASQLVRTLAYEKSSCADAKYLERVQRQIVAAVCQANQSRSASHCGVGKGIEDKVSFNRRQRMKNGLTYTHAGQGNPDILGYAGPADPEVGVLGSWDSSGKLQGCVVDFACHATTNPGGISANYIYYLEQTIRGSFGPQSIVLFFPGDSGDVTQVDNLSRYANPPGERWAQLVGGRVGAEAVKVLSSMEPGRLAPLDARSKLLTIHRRVPSPERVRQCLELVTKDPKDVGATRWAFAKEIVLLDALLAKSPSAEVEVQAIQVGPAVFLASPGELFCQYQLQQKAQSPFPMTFCVSVANGFEGYVPTDEAMGDHGGGYETRLTSVSNLEVGAGRRIVETALELARQMTPGPLPMPPKAPPFHQPWPYGNVPPERE